MHTSLRLENLEEERKPKIEIAKIQIGAIKSRLFYPRNFPWQKLLSLIIGFILFFTHNIFNFQASHYVSNRWMDKKVIFTGKHNTRQKCRKLDQKSNVNIESFSNRM